MDKALSASTDPIAQDLNIVVSGDTLSTRLSAGQRQQVGCGVVAVVLWCEAWGGCSIVLEQAQDNIIISTDRCKFVYLQGFGEINKIIVNTRTSV